MKKNYFITCCSALLLSLQFLHAAQSPVWQWAKNGAGQFEDKSYSIAVDASGNSYITGHFASASLSFGSISVTNPNNGGGVYSDLFIAKFDPNGNPLWATSAGGIRSDVSNSIAVDASGNMYITGYTYSPSITFGSITLTPNNGIQTEMFIAKFDPSGNALWAKSAGGMKDDFGNAVSVDAAGNVFAVGNFESDSVSFGNTTLHNSGGSASTSDGFVVKFDVNGNVLWAETVGGPYEDFPNSISTDALGNSYVAGTFLNNTIIGSTTLNGTGGYDCFVAKYDASGNVLWATSAGGIGSDYANSISFDAAGNSYVAGYFESATLLFASDTLTNTTQYSDDLFIAKFGPSGNPLWAKGAGGNRDDFANSIAVDASGNSFVTGSFRDTTLTIGLITLHNHDQNGLTDDLFLLKLDAFGNELWAKSENADAGTSVAVDAVGNGYVTGYFNALSVTFGSDSFANVNTTGKVADIFVAKVGKEIDGIYSNENVNGNISIFPNPSSGIFHFEMSGEKNSQIEIYNALGKIISKTKFTNNQAEIDLSQQARGIYFYRVVGEGEIITTGKIVLE